MGGLYSRIKNWVAGDTILASDINAEFDNVLNNFIPTMISSYSATVSQMRVQTDPGESGTESQATSAAGELERLRFALAEIKGTTYWYQSATTSLSQLNSALGATSLNNRVSSGRTTANSSQPLFLVPDGTAATITLKGASTNLVYSVRGTQYTISTDVTATGLTLAPSTNNTCTVNDANLSAQSFAKLVGENGTQITVSSMGSSISALTGQIAAFKTGTEYFLARVESTTALTKCMRGIFFNSADTRFARVAISNADTITLMKLTWVFAKTDGTLALTYTNPRYGAVQPTSPSIGDYWFDTVNNYWKIYNSTTFVDATATLVGICLQDTSGTKAARSFDFFKNYSDLNTVELVKDSSTELRGRYAGSQISVYGTQVGWSWDFPRWNTATDFDSGESLSGSTMYYLYVKETGACVISSVAPIDMRSDRRGFYHPGEAYRCVGFARTDGSNNWQECDSFYASDRNSLVTALTAAVSNLLPVPYNIQFKERTFTVDGTSAGFTQILPPAAQFKGEVISYVRTDTTIANVVVLDGYGSETINGALTFSLYTQYESVRLLSDGSNWFIVGRFIPSTWTSSGVLVITGTTANPTKGTVATDATYWRRVGNSAEIRMEYRQTAAGSGGTGDYLFALPTGLTIDTAKLTVFATVGGNLNNNCVGIVWLGLSGTSQSANGVSVFDSTHVRFQNSNNANFVSATNYSLTGTALCYNAWFSVPISGWGA